MSLPYSCDDCLEVLDGLKCEGCELIAERDKVMQKEEMTSAEMAGRLRVIMPNDSECIEWLIKMWRYATGLEDSETEFPWVCEKHPILPWPHFTTEYKDGKQVECPGPGQPPVSQKQLYVCCVPR